MTQENGGPAETQKATRHRSPNYPGISLKTASEKITSWFKADGHVASPKDAVIKHLGGDPGRVISALKSFGLVDEESGRVKLTQRGLDIAARRAEDQKRIQALKEAVVSPAIYRDLLKEYPGGRVSDTTLQSELIASKHFNPNYVNDFIKDFKATLEFAGISPSTVVESAVDEDEDKEEASIHEGDYVQWESQGALQFPVPRRVTGFSDDGEWAFVEGSNTGVPVPELTVADPPVPVAEKPGEKLKSKVPPANPRYVPPSPPIDTRQDVFSIGEGAVTVQWPAMLSAESFEDVSAWLDILKRKIGRSVEPRASHRVALDRAHLSHDPTEE